MDKKNYSIIVAIALIALLVVAMICMGCEKKNNGNENLYTIEEIQDEEMKIREYMILKLRLLEGVNCREFYEKFNVDILEKFKNEIKKLQSQELIEIAESENKSEEQDKNGKDKEKNKGNKNEKER